MKQKAKTLLAGILVLAGLCCGPRVLAQTLLLHHPGGTTTDVELFTQPRIEYAYALTFDSGGAYWYDWSTRSLGQSVRPVR